LVGENNERFAVVAQRLFRLSSDDDNAISDPFALRQSTVAKLRYGSWLCKNALPEVSKRRDLGEVAMWQHFFGSNYALIAAMSG
jgi:hypothetical protein